MLHSRALPVKLPVPVPHLTRLILVKTPFRPLARAPHRAAVQAPVIALRAVRLSSPELRSQEGHRYPGRVPRRSVATAAATATAASLGAASVATIASASVAVPALIWLGMRYKVSRPDQYLVRTGLGIPDIRISKQGFQWPFQKYSYIEMQPRNYTFELQAMTSEKMEFSLPGVFTIGPRDHPEALVRFARTLLALTSEGENKHLEQLVKGVLEGEVRILSAQMTVEQIFNDRKFFKDTVISNVQKELEQFGLQIYNANIKELQDSPGSEYFSYIRQKKRSEAENRAKIDVAEAKKAGDIGMKEREAVTRQQVVQYEADTVTKENSRKQEIEKSTAELDVVKISAQQQVLMARVQAQAATQQKEAELQREVEQRRISLETEKLRAREMSKAQVQAEAHAKEAEGRSNAIRIAAEATLFSTQREAEGRLFAKQKEADGELALYTAQAQGLQKLFASLGNDRSLLAQYLMLEKGTYEKLAQTNAEAVRGMQPKITVWNTGSGDALGDVTRPISEIMRSLPPLLTTIHEQTGVKPAEWLMKINDHAVIAESAGKHKPEEKV